MNTKKSQLAVIFFTVFLYLVGFGLVIPIIPVLAREFGATSLQVGLLLSVYSLMQFVFAPFWGRLSDRFGRRPIILFCLLGEVFAYIGFSLARNFEGLFAARLFAGFFGASISTASAYISDITEKSERSKGMALIGAAFGLGFLVGPALGGGLSIWGQSISPEPHFGTSFAALWVAGLCLVNFFFGFKFLKESLSDENRKRALEEKKQSRFAILFRYVKMPLVGNLIGVFFLASLAMSTMEATLVLFVGERFHWGLREVSFGFAYVGFIMVLSQGFLVRRLLPKVGEKKMMFMGLTMMGIGLGLIAVSNEIWILAVSQTILAFGASFTNPSVMGSISLLSPSEEQGAAMGTTQGTASLGRIIGPAMGGFLFQAMGVTSPFILGAFLSAVALLVVFKIYKKLPDAAKDHKTSDSKRVPKTKMDPLAPKALPIGFFQFDNLVRTHVPFLLFTTTLELGLQYGPRESTHIQNHANVLSHLTFEDVQKILAAKNTSKDSPIVVLCGDGQVSEQIAHQLTAAGYLNVYYILEGVAGLKS